MAEGGKEIVLVADLLSGPCKERLKKLWSYLACHNQDADLQAAFRLLTDAHK